MSALEKMREAFEECTVMAGVEPDFECIYITKDAANVLFDEAEAENAKLRELVRDMWPFAKAGWVHTCPNRECCLFEECDADSERECPIEEHMAARMRELGVEVNDG